MRRKLLIVAIVYFSASLIHGPIDPEAVVDVPHWRLGRIILSYPMVLSGDSPHYWVAVNSLLEDSDFDLSNNYGQAKDWRWDRDGRLGGMDIEPHVDRVAGGKMLSTHSPFFALLLAGTAWPFRGTQWVESMCILMTMLVGLIGVVLFARQSEESSNWVFALALATPLWCYSRDLWTESWVATFWMGVLFYQNPAVLAGLGFVGTLIKYPFAVVPITMGLLALQKKDYRRGWAFLGSGVLGLLVVVLTIQYLFREADHFSLFHSGVHLGFDWPFDGMMGLLLGPENGILWFSPFLAWGLWQFRRQEMSICLLLCFFWFMQHIRVGLAVPVFPRGTSYQCCR